MRPEREVQANRKFAQLVNKLSALRERLGEFTESQIACGVAHHGERLHRGVTPRVINQFFCGENDFGGGYSHPILPPMILDGIEQWLKSEYAKLQHALQPLIKQARQLRNEYDTLRSPEKGEVCHTMSQVLDRLGITPEMVKWGLGLTSLQNAAAIYRGEHPAKDEGALRDMVQKAAAEKNLGEWLGYYDCLVETQEANRVSRGSRSYHL